MMRILAAGVLLSLASCARREMVPQPGEAASETATAVAPAITLERTACFGSCPVYSISVWPSGEVKYEGKVHVSRMGAASARVPRERLEALLSEIERAGYFSFADRYTSGEPSCGRYATDSPTVITSVTLRGRTKRITHDYGCGGAPGALTILERKIDDVLGSDRWTGR
jgi:hypothetical protein